MAAERTLALDLGDGAIVQLALILTGRFVMGSPGNERGRDENEGPLPVGSLKSNARGLHGMHDDLAEWRADFFAPYPWESEPAPKGPNAAASALTLRPPHRSRRPAGLRAVSSPQSRPAPRESSAETTCRTTW